MTEDEDRLRRLLRTPLAELTPVHFVRVPVPSRARRTATLATVVVIVALITGSIVLFRSTSRRPASVAEPPPATVTPMHAQRTPSAALALGVPCAGPLARPAQLLRFRPVVALRCEYVAQGSHALRTRAIATGSLQALVRGLERTDVVASGGTVCADYLDLQPQLVLVDASGRYLRPRFPRDACGHLHGTSAYLAYLGLNWRQVAATKVALNHRIR
jgi:hypothetical protein